MVLAARWRERPPVLVVSVDHGLRPEAAEEAQAVAVNAATLGLPWRIVTAPKRGSDDGNLQDWARRVRYRLLAEAAHDAGFDAIVTAHHQDDQAETFLLRLARGSGVYGLGAMPEEGAIAGIMLTRPLLDVPRAALRKIASESGLPIVDDPSNSDLRFDRIRMREAAPALAALGFAAPRLAATAGRLRRAASALDHYATALIRDRFAADPFGVVRGPASAFADVPEEVALRALAFVLKAVSGADYTPRLDSVEALNAAILALGAGETLQRTLSGVVVAVSGDRLTARREWGRKGLDEAAAPAGATLLWDRRFKVGVPAIGGALAVAALARSKRRFRAGLANAATVRALPGLYRDGTLVAVPRLVEAADKGGKLGLLEVECLVGPRLGLTREKPGLPP